MELAVNKWWSEREREREGKQCENEKRKHQVSEKGKQCVSEESGNNENNEELSESRRGRMRKKKTIDGE